MLMIRLARVGKTKEPYFRLLLAEKGRDLYGRSKEILGFYNPRTKAAKLQNERIKYWLSRGAQASPTVHNLLINNKIIEGKKRAVTHLKQAAQKKAQAKEENKKPPENKETPAEAASDNAPKETAGAKEN